MNARLQIAVIYDNDLIMSKHIEEIEEELKKLAKPTVSFRTIGEIEEEMKHRGYFTEPVAEFRKGSICEWSIDTWFCNITFYNITNLRDQLHGKRCHTMVLADDVKLDKEYYLDVLEPMASVIGGGMVLLSKFLKAEPTKYTRSIDDYFRKRYDEEIVNHFGFTDREL